MSRITVDVQGLREFQRGLREIDKNLPKTLRLALNEAANLLIDQTRPLIPRRSGAAAASLKPRSTQRTVRIAVGGKRAPYYPWLDFGGTTGRGGGARRPFYKEGRYLYPTLRKNRDEFTKIMEKAIVAVAKDAGIEVD